MEERQIAVLQMHVDEACQSIEELGPVVSLTKEADEVLQRSLPNIRAAVETSARLRAKVQVLLEKPKCGYDEKMLALANALKEVPLNERSTIPRKMASKGRQALTPYCCRAGWLSVEEKSSDRLLSGLIVLAVAAPGNTDARDLMIALTPTHVAAGELKFSRAEIFEEASTFALPAMQKVFQEFAKRNDVTLEGFGWKKVQTEHGLRFQPKEGEK
jgi:hypothetical protein